VAVKEVQALVEQAEPVAAQTNSRDDVTGQFLPGKSGNPSGRPMTNKQKILDLHNTLTLAVRGRVKAEDVIKVVERTFKEALGSGKQAAANRKLVFEYFLGKPKEVDEIEDKGQSILIKIENATFKAQQTPSAVVEGEYTEVTSNG
jgi:Family of unknown function (DUF5681)